MKVVYQTQRDLVQVDFIDVQSYPLIKSHTNLIHRRTNCRVINSSCDRRNGGSYFLKFSQHQRTEVGYVVLRMTSH